MNSFPTIEEVHAILDEIAEELPQELFEKLNEGIILLPEYKMHPESRATDILYIMGEYSHGITGRRITIYYGSFKKIYSGTSLIALREKLKGTLLHEFTHHLESLAGDKDLEIEDAENLARYKENKLK
ncbi:Zinicin-like metallopeptidase [Proteiniborus ethanoligenes]|uniref:Zinicin-like metallopeptidase n=1 Tax=Proteiniborus ethanoligenes TaxID=415015 RepID=A0A1H3PAD2_9FIRM|nr:metallopeptidase family protein [Proteiniborus ethanoligenes]TAH62696.1 MAG: metallopeptidase family protein [Gottschalkiaceae bacterium]SDY97349.1 Zinicin-like metallopeptidase [Proteiniborus ethanoligenes]